MRDVRRTSTAKVPPATRRAKPRSCTTRTRRPWRHRAAAGAVRPRSRPRRADSYPEQGAPIRYRAKAANAAPDGRPESWTQPHPPTPAREREGQVWSFANQVFMQPSFMPTRALQAAPPDASQTRRCGSARASASS